MFARFARIGITLVVDASAIVALLLETGPDGKWVSRTLDRDPEIAAPALMNFEVANTIRRHLVAGKIDAVTARSAHAELQSLRVAEAPYSLLAARAWELRDNFTIFDAAYIALAEMLGATLVTLDVRLARGPGIRCQVVAFEDQT